MSAWGPINEAIRRCRAEDDAIGCLRELFSQRPDGMVALALGQEHERSPGREGDPEPLREALRWFEEAETRFPMATWKARAREAAARVRSQLESGPGPADDDRLYVVSCTKRKLWDQPGEHPRYVPADQAYVGESLRRWREHPASQGGARWLILSAKYGFIEPDHPIANYDVTFSLPATGPLSGASLRAQAEGQERWGGIPLRSFRRIVVFGSAAYVEKVRRAFPWASVVSVDGDAGSPSSTAAPAMGLRINASRAETLGRLLAEVPQKVWKRIDEGEPEWPVLLRLVREVPEETRVLTAIVLGLSDYQLGAGGAKALWREVEECLDRICPSSPTEVESFAQLVMSRPVAARLANAKMDRVRRLLASDLPIWLAARSTAEVGAVAMELWTRLGRAMRQPPDAKTIAFAMKLVDLLHRAETGAYIAFPALVPIIADLRIARVSASSGLVWSDGQEAVQLVERLDGAEEAERGTLLEAWASVCESSGGVSLFRIDSLIWQVAEPIYRNRWHRPACATAVAEVLAGYDVEPELAREIGRELAMALPDA